MHAVGIDLIGRKMFGDLGRQIRREPVVFLPVEIMRGVGRVGDVDGVDPAALLLRDALENPLGAGTLHPDADAEVLGFERPRQPFCGREFKRRIERNLALFLGRFDQRRRHFLRRRRGGPHRLGKQGAGHRCRRCLQQVASRPSAIPHCILPYATAALGR